MLCQDTCIFSDPSNSDIARTRQTGANGCLLAGMSGKVVDGELWLKGPNVVSRYHNRPKADAEAFTADGWMKTGDRVRLDEQGRIYVTDRIKEVGCRTNQMSKLISFQLIKYKAFQVRSVAACRVIPSDVAHTIDSTRRYAVSCMRECRLTTYTELEDLLISRDDVLDAGVVSEDRPDEATEVPRAYGTLLMRESSEKA